MFREIKATEIKENPISLISKDWALVTAGTKDNFNMLTASWGSIGELWGKDMATIYIRESRYTKEFIDSNDYFSLSFFDDKRKELTFCGRNSGRDVDKVKEIGFTPDFNENAPYFDEAKLVIICKKVAVQKMDENGFIDKEIMPKNYADNDMHYIYFGEIEKVLISD